MVILLSFFKFEKIVNKQSESFRRKLVDSIGSGYDFVFIIGGVDTTDSFVAELKRKNPTSKFILYLWDSLENKPNMHDFNFDILKIKFVEFINSIFE